MCEQLVARSPEPFRLDDLWPLVERAEHYGEAGFGWGVAWIDGMGTLREHRSTSAFADDPDAAAVGRRETIAALVHLRRPSKLSTIQLADTQPFLDVDGRFAFSHNGEFTGHKAARAAFAAQGRITGRADTEVGQRWLEDAWATGEPAPALLRGLHAAYGGVANLATLAADGTAHHYAGNPDNPVFAFRLGPIGVASTGLYSIDRSLFAFAAKGATHRSLVRQGRCVCLGPDGAAALV